MSIWTFKSHPECRIPYLSWSTSSCTVSGKSHIFRQIISCNTSLYQFLMILREVGDFLSYVLSLAARVFKLPFKRFSVHFLTPSIVYSQQYSRKTVDKGGKSWSEWQSNDATLAWWFWEEWNCVWFKFSVPISLNPKRTTKLLERRYFFQ